MILSDKAKAEQLETLAQTIEKGSNNATFIFLNDSNEELAVLSLPKPAIKQINQTSIELYQTDAATVKQSGVAKTALLVNADSELIASLEIGIDVVMSSSELVAGGTLMLDSILLTM